MAPGSRRPLPRVSWRWWILLALPWLACSKTSVPPPPSTGWTHQPPGFTAWADWGLEALSGRGWSINNPQGYASVITEPSAPLSPPSIGQWRYPAGFPGGQAPATMYHALPPSFTEGFVGVWWKPSQPWQGHPSQVNKIYFLLGGACGNLVPVMYGPPGGGYQLRVAPEWGSDWTWLTPNVNNVAVTLGAWHQLEMYFKYNSPAKADGIVRWWMDGTAIGDHRTVSFPPAGCFGEFQVSPTWGGVGHVKTQTDHFWFDHIYIGVPSKTPPAAAAPLIQEGFEDDRLAARGWYDNTTPLLSATEHLASSARSIEYHFPAGATRPTAGAPLRRKFAPTESVYLSYHVKYSANWVGSQRPYHPHEFHFLTTADDDWAGLSVSHLTVYVEQNGGTPLIAIQDAHNIDNAKIGVNLSGMTEARAVAGCNGASGGPADNCYPAGRSGAFLNEKKWLAARPYFTDAPGRFAKSDWHRVEAYVKLNTITGGRGVSDGVIQYWLDGELILDHHDVLLRTGAHPTMRFNQLVIAPYIGDGSPVAQSMWIDDLTVATDRPAGGR